MPLVSKAFGDIITFSRASGATWFNSAGNLIGVDFSTSSNTIGTGSKTFTLDATAGVNRSWATGDSVLIVDQANSANNMTGAVTSYTASTQTLVVNVTSTAGSGTITSWRIGNLMQRLDYNPSTLAAQGLLIEEQRTNSIRNNTMQGAVAGTPGTLPTNWNTAGVGTLVQEIVGTGTDAGITYVDYRLSGTTSTSAFALLFDATTQIVAASGQTWTSSFYIKLQNGSTTNITGFSNQIRGYNGGVLQESSSGTITLTSSLARSTHTFTLANASTTRVINNLLISFASGVAIDITLRIGLPQLEEGAFATSVIPTTTTALTRSADVASVNTLSPWYNASEGTIYAEYQTTHLTATQFAVSIDDSPSTSRATVAVTTTTFNGAVVDAGVTQATITQGTASTSVVKNAFAFAVNDFAFSANGAAPGTDTSGTVPSVVTQMSLGRRSSGSGPLSGYIRRVTYYPRRLSNAELQAITA